MKKNILIVLTLLSASVVSLSSQTIKIANDADVSSLFKKDKTTKIEDCLIQVTYRLEVTHDTINSSNIKENIMMLELGSESAKYFDLHNAKSKAHMIAPENKNRDPNEVLNEVISLGRGTLSDEIYWNYPEKGMLTVATHMTGDYYLYKEKIPNISWKIEKETQTVANHLCRKATCTLFGRNYIVWYTSDIPLSKGPWKFSGLPGLILKVDDDRKQISWICIGLEKSKNKDILYIEREYISTTKDKFLKSFNSYKRDPLTMLKTAGKISSSSAPKVNNSKMFNPIELN